MNVPFIDLQQQYRQIKPQAEKALKAVFSRGDFILGQEVERFEEEFRAKCGSRFALGVNSGTDALFLSLKALGIGPGDEVIVPDFTFIATAFAVSFCGAAPVFVDVDKQTYCIDHRVIAQAITPRTKAIIPVHLFGQCADMGPIMALAKKYGLKVIEDACQAHGARCSGSARARSDAPGGASAHAGSLGDTGCFSFYPTKNLGGFGDGGIIVTGDETIYRRLRQLRDCGRKPQSKYEHEVIGYNSRLDTLQAALLRVKLKKLDRWNKQRQAAAQAYDRAFKSAGLPVQVPARSCGSTHVYHVYAILTPHRDRVAAYLGERGVKTAVNYPLPLHLQPAFSGLKVRPGICPVSRGLCRDILSLPIYPGITKKMIAYTVKTIGEALHAV